MKKLKMIKKIAILALVSLMFLQAFDMSLKVYAEEANKIKLADPYGEYYKKDITKKKQTKAKQEVAKEEVLVKEASSYDNSSSYDGYEEVVDRRTENSKTYELASGYYVQEIFAEPIHKEVGGKLEEINNDLANISKARNLPIYQNKDGLYDFTVKDKTATLKNEKGNELSWIYEESDLTNYNVKNNVMLFTNAYPNVDMEYILSGDKVYTNYHINNKVEFENIKYKIKLNGLKAKQEEEYIDFLDKDGNSVYKVIQPILWDGQNTFGKTTFSYEEIDNETIEIKLGIDKEWVNNDERIYPIKLNTRAMTETNPNKIDFLSAYIRSNQTSTTSQYNHLFVGYDDKTMNGLNDIGTTRAFINIGELGLGAEKRILKANLIMYNMNAGVGKMHAPKIHAYQVSRVNTSAVNWNNQPYDTDYVSTTDMRQNYEGWESIDITKHVASHYKDGPIRSLRLSAEPETSPYYGFVFFNEGEKGNLPKIGVEYRDDWDVDPELSKDKFDTEMRVIAKLNEGFKALSFDGIAKPNYNVEFHLKEKLDDDTRLAINMINSMGVASKKFIKPIVVSNPYGNDHAYNIPFAPTEEKGNVNYTTNYVKEENIPKFDIFYEYFVQVVNGADKSTLDFYTDGFIKYKVKNGDTLKTISAYYGVTVEDIRKDNNLTETTIKEDQILLVRFKKNNPKVPKDVYTPPTKKIAYEAKFVYRGPACYGHCYVGDPINTANGNFYHESADVTIQDYEELSLKRFYNSTGPQLSNMFGNGFTSNLEQYLTYDKDGNMLYFKGDGKIFQFEKDGTSFKVRKEDRLELIRDGKKYSINDLETNTIYGFDEYGSLDKITNKQGFESKLTYNEYGQIEKISLGEKQIGFIYNENNLVKEISLPNGKKANYAYDKNRNLTSFTDAAGNVETYTYDNNNFLTSIKDKNGNKIADNTYDDDGVIKSQKDGNGNKIKFSYKEDETKVTYDDGTVFEYGYEDYKINNMVNGDGSSSTYEYDEYGNIVKKVDEENKVTTYTYDKHNLLDVENPDGTSETYTYDSNNNITSHKDVDGSIEKFEYSGSDLVKHSKVTGEVLTYTYDASHRIQSETNNLGATKIFTYSGNQVATMTQDNGLVTSYQYDLSGNMVKESDNQGKVFNYIYNDNNLMTQKTYPDGSSESWGYDGNNNITQYKDRLGGLSANTYDKNNNLLTTTKGSLTNSKIYDSLDRVIKETDEQGLSTKYVYDGNGNKVKETNPYGNVITYTYDEKSRLLTTTDVQGNVETNTYSSDNIIETIGFDGLVTTFTYDGFNREISKTNPNGMTETKEYDGLNLSREVNEFGHETVYTYDTSGREIKNVKTIGEDTITTTKKYDKYRNVLVEEVDGIATTHEYDVYNRETKAVDALGNSISKEYDFDDNLVKEIDALGFSQETTFNGNGDVLIKIDKNGSSKTNTYDVNGALLSEVDELGFTTTYAYNNKGQAVSTTNAYGIETVFEYDTFGNKITTTMDGKVIEEKEYDEYGQEIKKKDLEIHETYEYDSLGRIVSTTNELTGLVTYVDYDKYGNVIKEYDNNNKASTTTYDEFNRGIISKDAYGRESKTVYDIAGNVVETESTSGTTISVYDKYQNLIETTNELGLTTTYEYNELNQKIKESCKEKELLYTYDARGQEVEVKDENRKTTISTTYDGNGNVLSTTDALGNVTQIVFDAKGQEIKTIDAAGNETTTEYDANGNITKVTDALGNTTQTTYNSFGMKEKEVDKRGFDITYIYNDDLQLIKIEDKLGLTASVRYNKANQVEEEVDQNGNKKTYKYDVYGQVTEEMNGLGTKTTRKYDVLGNLIEEKTANRITKTIYDKSGNISYIDVNGKKTEINEYNERNQKTASFDSLGNKSTYAYDVFGNQKEADEKGFVTKSTYNVYGELIKHVENESYVQTNTYDVNGQLIKTKTNDRTTLQKEYDANGNEVKTIENGFTKEIVYDELNRPTELKIESVKNDGSMVSVQQIIYDEADNVIEEVDADGNKKLMKYDANGNLISETDARGSISLFDYDGLNNLVKAQNPQNRVVSYVYDASNKVTLKNINGKYAKYTYDAFGSLIDEKNEYGYHHEYKYDVYGNQTSHSKPDGTTIKYTYDSNNNMLSRNDETYTYDTRGNKTSSTNKNGTVSYSYDKFNQLTKVTDSENKTVTYKYNKYKELTHKNYANGDKVTYDYDAKGQLTTVKKNDAVNATYAYNNRGEVIALNQPGVSTTYAYDEQGRKSNQQVSKDGSPIKNISYAYDANDNITKQVEDGKEDIFTYNELDELVTSSKHIDGTKVDTTYGYDAFGNKTVTSSSEGKKTYHYNNKNQLEKVETDKGYISYRYDDNGNMTNKINESGQNDVYSYNEFDQLEQIIKGPYVYDYAYDGDGERISQTRTDTRSYPMTLWYDYNEAYDVKGKQETSKKEIKKTFNQLREQVKKKEANGNACAVSKSASYPSSYKLKPEVATYVLDRNQEYTQVLEKNGKSNIHGLSLLEENNAVQVLGLNDSVIAEVKGTNVENHNYSDYGASTKASKGHYYNGEYADETGLIYLRARYYDPEIGTFIQIDNNYAGEQQDVSSQNRYNYTLNNPYKYVDRDGNKTIPGVPDSWYKVSLSDFKKMIQKKLLGLMQTAAINEWYRRNPPTSDAVRVGARPDLSSNETQRGGRAWTTQEVMTYETNKRFNAAVAKVFVCPKPKQVLSTPQSWDSLGVTSKPVNNGNQNIGQGASNWYLHIKQNARPIDWGKVGTVVAVIGAVAGGYYLLLAVEGVSLVGGILTITAAGLQSAQNAMLAFQVGQIAYGAKVIGGADITKFDEIIVATNILGSLASYTLGALPTGPQGSGGNTSWYNEDGSINYPPNNGAVPGTEKTVSLQPGSSVGRYGVIKPESDFVTQSGATSDKLSLPPTTDPNTYQNLKVLKPIEGVTQSTVAPWGGSSGGGLQYHLPKPIEWYIKEGYLGK